MNNFILYLGPDDFRGFMMPEQPRYPSANQDMITNGRCWDFYEKEMKAWKEQVESLKANAPKVVNYEILPTFPKPHIDGWILPKNLKSGDTFPLPEGYEFKHVLQVRHGVEWHDLANQTVGRDPEGIYQTVLRIVKVEVKSEVKEETPPFLKFKFDPLAELTYEEWEKMSKIKRPENTKDNKAWAGAWLEGEMSGYAKCMINKVLSKPEPEESQKELLEELLRMSLRSDERILDHFIIQRKK